MRKMKFIASLLLLLTLAATTGYAQEGSTGGKAKLIITLTDFDGNPLSGKTMVAVNQQADEEYKGETNKQGKVTMKVPKGSQYKVIYRAVNGPKEFRSFKIPDKRGHLTFKFTAQYQEAEDQVYTLENVYFDTDKATLRESSNEALNDLLKALATNPEMRIEIAGHTDDKGAADYNRKLSRKRAESVKQYLVERGIAADRIKAKGYGESKPIASNATAQGRQKNRRTEVRILQE